VFPSSQPTAVFPSSQPTAVCSPLHSLQQCPPPHSPQQCVPLLTAHSRCSPLQIHTPYAYSSRHQTACFKATEGLRSPYRAALSNQHSVASFATLRVFSCLHSPGLCCSCCNVVRFCCGLEVCNLVTDTIVR
jgi:hypothetical protein